MKHDYSGQTVLITGATRGIGAAIADQMRSAGARLLLTGTDGERIRTLNEGARQQGDLIRWLQVDFADTQSTELFLSAIEEESAIDVLINNAGINRIDSIEQTRREDIDDLLTINLRAPILLTRAVAKSMKRRNYGRIVNIASIWGVITKHKRALYTAAKHGLVGLTKTTAVDLARHNVIVNAVSPGFTRTELTMRTMSEEEQMAIASQIPLGRLAQPSEMAEVVMFLASASNTYLTGQNIIVDGGYCNV